MPNKINWKDREEVRRYKREYRQRNKEGIKKYDGEYCKKNKDRIKSRGKEYYQNNKEKVDRKYKEYYQKHKQKIGKRQKEYTQKNKRRKSEYDGKYREKQKVQENERRTKLGLPLVGEGFQKEMELLLYVHRLFQNYDILTHHRACGGGQLELDIYLPELKLGLEYMGPQHYKWIKFFHKTEEEFEYQQYKDRCKKKLCKMRGITLISIRFDEKLSEQLILSKLKHYPKLIKAVSQRLVTTT